MTRAQKEAISTAILALVALVRRVYDLSDTSVPQVVIGALPPGIAHTTIAFYGATPPRLHFRPTYLSVPVVTHELAHWVQHARRGDTDCGSTPFARRSHPLAAEHAAIQETIMDLARRAGYDVVLTSLVARSKG